MKRFVLILALALAFSAFQLGLTVCAQAQTLSYLAVFNGSDGFRPTGSMVQATDGNFYGYANLVFRMTPGGDLKVVYDWCSHVKTCSGSLSGPILGNDGNLYGVTSFGGLGTNSGTLYKLTLDGQLTTLWTFCAQFECAPGPNGIIQASDGNFYGTSELGQGAIFRISPTSGATTGTVSVVTPSGTLNSNPQFVVTK